MPVDCTDTGWPLNVAGEAEQAALAVDLARRPSKNVSAMYFARSGSPGSRHASA